MIVIFKKDIKLISLESFMTFEKGVLRKDITDFLKKYEQNHKVYENDLINNRVIQYLKELRILNETGEITDKGRKIQKTGKLMQREEGKYRVYLTKNDEFLSDSLIYIERLKPDSQHTTPKLTDELYDIFDKEFTLVSIDNHESEVIKPVSEDKKISGANRKNEKPLELTLDWQDLDSSNYVISGLINNKKIKDIKTPYPCDLNKKMGELFPSQWETKYKRLKVKWDDLNDDEKKHFIKSYKYSDENSKRIGYKSITFTNIPLMPEGVTTAIEWRNYFIDADLIKKYHTRWDFRSIASRFNKLEGFEPFRSELKIPEYEDYIERLNSDEQAHRTEFWHLAAPYDLNPDKNTKSDAIISYNPGDTVSFSDIADRIRGGKSVDSVVYYDKYTQTEDQQKNLHLFITALSADRGSYLITNMNSLNNKPRSRYLEENNNTIEQIPLNVISSEKLNHSRYILLIYSDTTRQLWEISHSIDFIRFDNPNPTQKSKGVTEDVTFTKCSDQKLKKTLRDYIDREIMSNGKN